MWKVSFLVRDPQRIITLGFISFFQIFFFLNFSVIFSITTLIRLITSSMQLFSLRNIKTSWQHCRVFKGGRKFSQDHCLQGAGFLYNSNLKKKKTVYAVALSLFSNASANTYALDGLRSVFLGFTFHGMGGALWGSMQRGHCPAPQLCLI